jgi:hypothetical protein
MCSSCCTQLRVSNSITLKPIWSGQRVPLKERLFLFQYEVSVGRLSRDWVQARDREDQEEEGEEGEGPLVPPGTVQKAHIFTH